MQLFVLVQLCGAGIIAFLTGIYLGPILIRVAFKLNILDRPDDGLKNHKKPVPYLGGLVVYVATLVSLILFFPFQHLNIFFILGSTLLLLVGLIDDIVPIKPHQKLMGQIVATICFIKSGFYVKEAFLSQHHPELYTMWLAISVFWMLAIINAFNLVDVMDGLASTVALFASFAFLIVALAVNAIPAAIVLTSFMGALAGFLFYNLPPAKMYLGDAGSLFIGGMLAVIPFMIPWGSFSLYGYIAPPIILGIVGIECLTLIVIRTFKGIPFYAGSPHHFCHFLKHNGWTTRCILLYTIAASLCLSTIAMAYLWGTISLINSLLSLASGTCIWFIILIFGRKT